jgi:hypothetical protein
MVSNVELYDLNNLDRNLPNVCQRTKALVARGYLPAVITAIDVSIAVVLSELAFEKGSTRF